MMISDPHPMVSRMLARMVARLGYRPMVVEPAAGPTPAQLRSADVLLIEPASPHALALAHTARAANPAMAIIGEGAMVPRQDMAPQHGAPFRRDVSRRDARRRDVTLRHGAAVRTPRHDVSPDDLACWQDAWHQTAVPVAHLAKPFTIAQLDAALQQGFAHHDSAGRRAIDRRDQRREERQAA